MQILSDILQKEHVLITVRAEATSFEILRAILLYKELQAKALKPLFHVYGTPTSFFETAIKAEGIQVQRKLVKDTPFVIEIKKGSSRIKSVKVDKVGDKLKLFLIPSKGILPKDLVDVVGVNLPYSHIIGFGFPNYLDDLFAGVSYSKISAIREYGRQEFVTVSLDDFGDIIAKAQQMNLSDYVKKLLNLDIYNAFIEFFLTGEGTVDLLKVREALVDDVLSWGRKDYVRALANWQRQGDFIIGTVRVEESNFVPSMPMWADFVFLAETAIQYPVVTLVQLGKYLYTRIVSPVALPTQLQELGFWVKAHIAESIVIASQIEEWKNKIIALLQSAGIKATQITGNTQAPATILNTQETAYDALKKFKENSKEPEKVSGSTVWSSKQAEVDNSSAFRQEQKHESSEAKHVESVVVQVQPESSVRQSAVGAQDNSVDQVQTVDTPKQEAEQPKSEVNVQVSDEPLDLGDLVSKLAASNEGEDSSGKKENKEGSGVSRAQQNDADANDNGPVLNSDKASGEAELQNNTDEELERLADKIKKTLDL